MIKSVSGRMIEVRYVDIAALPICGLSNQLYLLVGGIIWCIQNNVPLLVVGRFLLEINTQYYSSIGKILYLSAINEHLRKKYGVSLVDISRTKFSKQPDNLSLYKLNLPMETCSELLNTDMGKDILNHIFFTPELVSVPMKFLNTMLHGGGHNTINVIHLRLESDAIAHWGAVNNMSAKTFHDAVVDRYIDLIKTSMPKNQPILLLSGNIDNEVTAFMKENNYTYHVLTKQSKYREVNAIMDMILGKMCSGVFIGAAGSTFSHLIAMEHSEDSRVSTHFVDMNNIQ